MIYSIKIGGFKTSSGWTIGGEDFEINEHGEFQRMFTYCEKTFGFKGIKWERIKRNYNLDLLEEIFKILDVWFEMYDE
ncbi:MULTISPECIES: hypothetical protein [Bacillus cereus group]|uniref:hypothetical protein n=1 Tax=Bacillus cereus group TaxID=86661 RepID=UPI0022DEA6F6|nr:MULTISPECIES: hypothetical protein [unclassified Bacillus cereus group]MDA2026712.1 hypothetical protein [Bacillus cereus group sp. Bcc03]MDA2713411.1 hypothetical protein [Bacillus cereus group sp. Bc025]HDR7716932.1 hypothetical protein [Bacillus albus]